MYPRLRLARNLLRDDGVIFIQISQKEYLNLLKICNEIFGEENFIESLIWRKKSGGGQQDAFFVTEHEYIIIFAKNKINFHLETKSYQTNGAKYNEFDNDRNKKYRVTKLAKWGSAAHREDRPTMYFALSSPDGQEIFPVAPDGLPGRWRYGKQRMKELTQENLIEWKSKNGMHVPYEKEYEPENEDQLLKERSILYDLAENTEGSNELTEIFGKKDVFDNPKPSDLVAHLISLATTDDDYVLDFFAGSGTTAQAIFTINTLDNCKRKVILVQLPEKLQAEKKEARSGFDFCISINKPTNIAELSKERIRRAGEKIKAEKQSNQADLFNQDSSNQLDIGFKVFKLDETNFTQWDEESNNIESDLYQYTQSLKPNRTQEDALYEILLKYGIDLALPITELEIQGKRVFSLANNYLLICLERDLTLSIIEEIAKLKPNRVVFYDDGFRDDHVKLNAEQTLKKFGVEDIRVI